MERYGFVYIWYDKRRKMYYLGCHWGLENDNYICSSNWMRNTYHRHKKDFKRRIISRIYTNRQDLFEREYYWLQMIKENELGKKYYNLSIKYYNYSKEKLSKSHKGKKDSEETKLKKSQIMKQKWQNLEYRKKMLDSRTLEVKEKSYQKLKKIWESDEYKQSKSLTMKEKWNDNEYRTMIASAIKNSRNDEFKQNMSKLIKEKWQDPNFRNLMLSKVKRNLEKGRSSKALVIQ